MKRWILGFVAIAALLLIGALLRIPKEEKVPTLRLLEGRSIVDQFESDIKDGAGLVTVYTFDGDIEEAVKSAKRDLYGKDLKYVRIMKSDGWAFIGKDLLIQVVPGVTQLRANLTEQQKQIMGASVSWQEEKGKVSVIIQERSRDALTRAVADVNTRLNPQ